MLILLQAVCSGSQWNHNTLSAIIQQYGVSVDRCGFLVWHRELSNIVYNKHQMHINSTKMMKKPCSYFLHSQYIVRTVIVHVRTNSCNIAHQRILTKINCNARRSVLAEKAFRTCVTIFYGNCSPLRFDSMLSRRERAILVCQSLRSQSVHWRTQVYRPQSNTIQYNTKFVKRHVAVASEALANRTVKKQRRRRTNVL